MSSINPQNKLMAQSARLGASPEPGLEQGQKRLPAPLRDHVLSREPREDGRCFECLIEMKEDASVLAQPWLDIMTPAPQWARQEPPEQSSPLPLATLDALLAQIQERLASPDEGQLRFELILPNLGSVSARLSNKGGQLNVNLTLAQEHMAALLLSQERQSEAWLSRQLKRPVRLTLQARES